MPRVKKHIVGARANGSKGAAALAVPPELHEVYRSAPPLTLQAPDRFNFDRGQNAQDMMLTARREWDYVFDNFDNVRLNCTEGAYLVPEDDYGGLRAICTFLPGERNTGLRFMGTPSYDKEGHSKQHEAKTHKPHRRIIQAVCASLKTEPRMQLIMPRVGFFKGVITGYHTDANPRGAHPNAMRPLDPGGGLWIYYGLDFRCSMIRFRGDFV